MYVKYNITVPSRLFRNSVHASKIQKYNIDNSIIKNYSNLDHFFINKNIIIIIIHTSISI